MKFTEVVTDAPRPEGKQKGVTTVEYAVMLVLVAIAVLSFGRSISDSVTAVFSTLASHIK